MANKERFTVNQMKEALEKAGGFLSVAAEMLGCTRKTIYNYLDRYSELKEVCEDIREKYLDLGENELIKKIKKGSTPELIFFLKTRGKHRGYVEKQELDISSGNEPIKININLDGGDNT
tara:strand:+ start:1430 stop:1786 length:357 start_codon:yes stop_codon:yes gene_type:complete